MSRPNKSLRREGPVDWLTNYRQRNIKHSMTMQLHQDSIQLLPRHPHGHAQIEAGNTLPASDFQHSTSGTLPLNECRVWSLPTTTSFCLVHDIGELHRVFELSVQRPEEANDWVRVIADGIRIAQLNTASKTPQPKGRQFRIRKPVLSYDFDSETPSPTSKSERTVSFSGRGEDEFQLPPPSTIDRKSFRAQALNLNFESVSPLAKSEVQSQPIDQVNSNDESSYIEAEALDMFRKSAHQEPEQVSQVVIPESHFPTFPSFVATQQPTTSDSSTTDETAPARPPKSHPNESNTLNVAAPPPIPPRSPHTLRGSSFRTPQCQANTEATGPLSVESLVEQLSQQPPTSPPPMPRRLAKRSESESVDSPKGFSKENEPIIVISDQKPLDSPVNQPQQLQAEDVNDVMIQPQQSHEEVIVEPLEAAASVPSIVEDALTESASPAITATQVNTTSSPFNPFETELAEEPAIPAATSPAIVRPPPKKIAPPPPPKTFKTRGSPKASPKKESS